MGGVLVDQHQTGTAFGEDVTLVKDADDPGRPVSGETSGFLPLYCGGTAHGWNRNDLRGRGHSFFCAKPAAFYRFYRDKMVFDPKVIRPNAAHLALARLEAEGKMEGTGIVTQNIDGLHSEAGSRSVFELHGSIHRNYCTRCGRFYPLSRIMESNGDPSGVPLCSCGGIIKPDVVLYQEALNEDVVDGAVKAIAHADLLIIGGTSMTVWPAAGLVSYFKGDRTVIINRDATAADGDADLIIRQPIGQVLGSLFD